MIDLDMFAAHRPNLFALAYRMLGSASNAEDVLQDAYLRYSAAPRAEVRAQGLPEHDCDAALPGPAQDRARQA